jgi:hypothetical protein
MWVWLIIFAISIFLMVYGGKSISFAGDLKRNPNAEIPKLYSKNKNVLFFTGLFMLIIGIFMSAPSIIKLVIKIIEIS